LFAVLSVSTFGAGAAGTGVLYASVSAGATVGALTTGWLRSTRRLGMVVIWAVIVWGSAIAVVGLARSLWVAALPLAVAGAADSVSAVASATGVRFSIVSGGLLCLVGVAGIMAVFPALARYDADRWIAEPATGQA